MAWDYGLRNCIECSAEFRARSHWHVRCDEHSWVTQHSRNTRLARQDYRQAILFLLGDKCAKCGIDDPRVLQVDHIYGGGHQDRQLFGSGGTWAFTKDVLQHTTRKYQLLCANCNWIKRWERGEMVKPN